MQIYSHPLIGALVGAVLFPQNAPAQLLCTISSIVSDGVMIDPSVLSKLKSAEPVYLSEKLATRVEISHSIPLWLMLTLLSSIPLLVGYSALWQLFLFTFSLGGLSHVIIDLLTHKDEVGAGGTDEISFMFPWTTCKLGRIFAIWTYRYGPGMLKPKPGEIVIDLLATAVLAWRWKFFHF